VSGHELAQVNVARLRAPMGAPASAGLVQLLAPLERLADEAPGFVWRHGHDGDDDDLRFVNLSVWRSYEDLHAFVYRSAHGRALLDRRRWFEPPAASTTALWWVAAGTRPGVDEALARLAHLHRHGPTPTAFSLRRRFGPDGRPVSRARRSR
jgi:heme-degrading monooxygenase HmoA